MAVTSIKRSGIVDYLKSRNMIIAPLPPVLVQYGIVAGGGAAAGDAAGGGGGYRSSYGSTSTGGGISYPENPLSLSNGSYTVTVGAGGASASRGGPSRFASLTATGGGSAQSIGSSGQSGGSGGGARGTGVISGGSGTSGQGHDGGSTTSDGQGGWRGGGGGGANSAASGATAGSGASNSQFTGSSRNYSGGGRGEGLNFPDLGSKSVLNDGHGNNAGGTRAGNPGLVSISVPLERTVTVGTGLTSTNSVVGNERRFVFTAGTGTIVIS